MTTGSNAILKPSSRSNSPADPRQQPAANIEVTPLQPKPTPQPRKPGVFRLPIHQFSNPVPDAELAEDDVPKTVRYENRYVAFIDILGFKELIKQSAHGGKGPQSLESIFNAMNLDFSGISADYARQSSAGAEALDLRVNTFSDFVVISCRDTPQGLDMLCFAVWCVARDWLSKGYLSRGGIAKGSVIHEGGKDGRPGLVFGPAFIEAYQLEQEVAEYPRVVLSKDVRQDVRHWQTNGGGTIQAVKKLVARCEDGPMCIDLFAHLRRGGFSFLGLDHRSEAGQFAATLHTHLEQGADVPRWHRKTMWLIEQFNEAVTRTAYADLTVQAHGV